MKELSIEEKAKRYDDAINAIKELKAKHPTAHVIKDWIKENFPELAESKDERIRQFLIHEVTETSDEIMSYRNMNKKDVLAWLEKQKHEEWSLYDEKILSEVFTSVEIAAYSEEKKKEIISWLQKYRPYMREKQGKQKSKFRVGDTIKCKYDDRQFTIKSVDLDKGTYTYTQEGCGNDIDYADEEFELVEQKPAWSEEDERLCQCIIEDQEEALDKVRNDKYGHSEIISDLKEMYHERINFLKSLKERIQPQKQEWKQENTGDLTDFENAMMHIGDSFFGKHAGLNPNDTNAIKEQANLLLELVPKQEWSEEDEKRLKRAIHIFEDNLENFENTGINDEIDESLISWLKSLKERVQPMQEWSEEDRLHYMNVLEALEYVKGCKSDYDKIEAAKSDIAWLKSLRPQNWTKEDRERYISCLQRLSTGNPKQPETINSKWFKEHVYPQNTWKPSDEQMTQLGKYCPDNRPLTSLYEQLKKLREE